MMAAFGSHNGTENFQVQRQNMFSAAVVLIEYY
jgi:hypothetical protein